MFELTNSELNYLKINMRSQIVTSNKGGNRYSTLVFTEQGVAMLSAVLKSDSAIQISIQIMNAFVAMRQYLNSRIAPGGDITRIDKDILELKQYIEEVFSDYNDINEDTAIQLELINQTLAELASKQSETEIRVERKKIGYK